MKFLYYFEKAFNVFLYILLFAVISAMIVVLVYLLLSYLIGGYISWS